MIVSKQDKQIWAQILCWKVKKTLCTLHIWQKTKNEKGMDIKLKYIENNKAAWEEAFEHRHNGWGEENHIRLQNERLPFFAQM